MPRSKGEGSNPDYRRFKEQQYAAKRRGIEWKLEFWEWHQIWQDSGHLHERGIHGGEWVMSRYGDKGAYETGNVRIVLTETNSSQGSARRLLPGELQTK